MTSARAGHVSVACAQIRSTPDVSGNVALVEEWTRRAADAGAQLVVFPEATMAPFSVPLAPVAEPLDGPFAERVRRVAASTGVVVVVGMFEPADEAPSPSGRARVHNTLLATDGRGTEAAYRKVHLYDAFASRESVTVAPGRDLVTLDALGARLGFATCYDVRFADQFTALGRAGAHLVCLPASWGDGPRKVEQWRSLTTARAMDAQAWLVASGQAAVDTGGHQPLGVGHSRVVGPLGECVAEASDDAELLVCRIDLGQVRDARERVPIL